MKVVVFAILIVCLSAIRANVKMPTRYRPDSSSCMRFHLAITNDIAECRKRHILHKSMYCTFDCQGSELRIFDCHIHENVTFEYPECDDLVCRDSNSIDFPGAYCNELPVKGHYMETTERYRDLGGED